jgi:hypothetical protein
MVKALRRWLQQFTCRHEKRVLEAIFREPIGYTRRAQYYCPECQRVWASCQMPEGISP